MTLVAGPPPFPECKSAAAGATYTQSAQEPPHLRNYPAHATNLVADEAVLQVERVCPAPIRNADRVARRAVDFERALAIRLCGGQRPEHAATVHTARPGRANMAPKTRGGASFGGRVVG